MSLGEQIFTAFHAVATGTLRLDPDSAQVFATHVAKANEGIHVVGQLCTGPNALKSETLALMLERWLRLLPEYAPVKRILDGRPGAAQSIPALDAGSALLLHARVFEVCVSQRGLSESRSLQVANHVREAAAGFFALEQKCRAPTRHTQRLLCATLRAALGVPLQNAMEAGHVYLGADEG